MCVHVCTCRDRDMVNIRLWWQINNSYPDSLCPLWGLFSQITCQVTNREECVRVCVCMCHCIDCLDGSACQQINNPLNTHNNAFYIFMHEQTHMQRHIIDKNILIPTQA